MYLTNYYTTTEYCLALGAVEVLSKAGNVMGKCFFIDDLCVTLHLATGYIDIDSHGLTEVVPVER